MTLLYAAYTRARAFVGTKARSTPWPPQPLRELLGIFQSRLWDWTRLFQGRSRNTWPKGSCLCSFVLSCLRYQNRMMALHWHEYQTNGPRCSTQQALLWWPFFLSHQLASRHNTAEVPSLPHTGGSDQNMVAPLHRTSVAALDGTFVVVSKWCDPLGPLQYSLARMTPKKHWNMLPRASRPRDRQRLTRSNKGWERLRPFWPFFRLCSSVFDTGAERP